MITSFVGWDITSVIAGYLNEQGEVSKVEVLL